MSRSESASDVSSSCSEGSDDDRSTNRDLVIPSPVKLSDSEDDGVSPSQYKLAMKKQWSPRYATPVVNLLPYTGQWSLMIDWDQASYSFIQLFLILQFRCTGNNWIDLQQRNTNQGNKV